MNGAGVESRGMMNTENKLPTRAPRGVLRVSPVLWLIRAGLKCEGPSVLWSGRVAGSATPRSQFGVRKAIGAIPLARTFLGPAAQLAPRCGVEPITVLAPGTYRPIGGLFLRPRGSHVTKVKRLASVRLGLGFGFEPNCQRHNPSR